MRLAVLGPVELLGDRGPVPISGRKTRQLLTVLALAAPQRLTVDRLADALWDQPPPSANKTVQGHLSRLRTALAAAGVPGALTGGVGGHGLDLPATALDVSEVTLNEHSDVNDPWWIGDTNHLLNAFQRHVQCVLGVPTGDGSC